MLAKKLKEHIAESQSRKQKEGRKRSTVNWQRTGRGLAEEDQHLAPDRNERRRRKEEQEQEADAVAKEAEQEQEQEQVEVHSKKIESSPGKNEKGKKKVGRPAKNETRKNMVGILLIYINFLKPFELSMLHYCHNMHTSN